MSTIRIGMSVRLVLFSLLLAFSHPVVAATAETNASSAAVSTVSNTPPSVDSATVLLRLQEQLYATQMAVERMRHDNEDASGRNAEALAAQLRTMEQKLSSQRSGETRMMMYVLTAFAGLSFVAVVLAAYFQWRTVKRLADFTASLPIARPLIASGVEPLALEDKMNSAAVGQSGNRLLGAVERLEKRILELEHAATPVIRNGPAATNGNGSVMPVMESSSRIEPLKLSTEAEQPERIQRLLEQGQNLLNEDKPEAAVEAFDLVLALDANNTEALVKKGSALEKLRKLPEAIECYDRAIAADGSMTIAYLHKGAVCNRLERFGDAVECYEKALRTQEKRPAA